jgi:hypothetical protein
MTRTTLPHPFSSCVGPAVAIVAFAIVSPAAARLQDPAPAGTTHAFGAPAPAGTVTPDPAEPTLPTPSPRPEEAPLDPSLAGPMRMPPVVAGVGAVWPHDPGLAALEAERAALEDVDHASHHAALEATRRIAALHAFVERRLLAAEFMRFSREYVPTLDQLTFDEAVAKAKAMASGAPRIPASNDVDHLEHAIEVESGVARASWNQLNRLRRSVDVFTAFLQSKDLLAQYQAWAPGYMRSLGWTPPAPPAGTAPPPDAVRRRSLQMEWDRAHRAQRASMPANPEPLVPLGGTPAGGTPEPDAVHGVVPPPVALGPSPARSVYSNSWWNGYADPYYDANGFPGRDPNLGRVDPNDPATYGYAPEAYSYHAWPMFWDLGWVVVPPLGLFPGGAVGGRGIGFVGGTPGGMTGGMMGGAFGGAAGGGK